MILILPCSTVCAKDKTIRGGVVYTVESARKLAFEGLDARLDKTLIKPFWYDEKNAENLAVVKTGKELNDRYIMAFSSGFVKGYAVVYGNKPKYAYYYTQGGILASVDYDPKGDRTEYPYKIGKYDAFGRLRSVVLYVSDDEQFSYSKSGKLISHWIGDIGYNANGKEIARRKVVEEIPE